MIVPSEQRFGTPLGSYRTNISQGRLKFLYCSNMKLYHVIFSGITRLRDSTNQIKSRKNGISSTRISSSNLVPIYHEANWNTCIVLFNVYLADNIVYIFNKGRAFVVYSIITSHKITNFASSNYFLFPNWQVHQRSIRLSKDKLMFDSSMLTFCNFNL